MAAIDNLMTSSGPDIYYGDVFHNVLEDHMTYLRGLSSTIRKDVELIDVIRYQADLFGLLGKLGIKPELQWIVMRMSGITSPAKVPDDLGFVLVPDEAEIARLKQTIVAVAQIQK